VQHRVNPKRRPRLTPGKGRRRDEGEGKVFENAHGLGGDWGWVGQGGVVFVIRFLKERVGLILGRSTTATGLMNLTLIFPAFACLS